VDPAYFENLRAALRAAVTGAGPVEPGMAALAGLVHAGDIAQLVCPGRDNAPLRARLAELAGQDPAMTVPGTRSEPSTPDNPFRHATQAAVHSAVHHSVHAAVSAATNTSHHPGGSSSGSDSSPTHHHHLGRGMAQPGLATPPLAPAVADGCRARSGDPAPPPGATTRRRPGTRQHRVTRGRYLAELSEGLWRNLASIARSNGLAASSSRNRTA
jgi:Golgi phosphoprotein 3 GPP34